MVLPVFIWQTPPEWLSPFVQQERMTHNSSAQVAVCGSQSETHRPPSPCCRHLRGESMIGLLFSPIARITGLNVGGIGFPLSSFSSGLGSKVSRWLGPPSMKRKMTDLARGETCGVLGARGWGLGAGAEKTELGRRCARARLPKPAPAERSMSRRECKVRSVECKVEGMANPRTGIRWS